MRPRGWIAIVAVVGIALIAPGSASAHAYLVKTVPAANGVLDTPPTTVALTYDEAVEPRLAIISVTSASGAQETRGPVRRSRADADTLVVPVRPNLRQGWYLVYWRAISVDGHPVQGAFTYAIGPNPGPAPRFAIPSIAGSATSAQPLVARTVMFLAVMIAIGLFVLRVIVARVLARRTGGAGLRALSVAYVVASVVGLFAIGAYLDASTAVDSLRSVFDVSALVSLFRVTASGRGYVDMLLCFALFCVAGWTALYLDRPDRSRRSIAELAAQTGALLAAGAALVVPGTAGHAAQTSPAGLTLSADWLHLVSGSLWLGGLVGLLVLWFAVPAARRVSTLSVVVPRFSNLALGAVGVLAISGTIEAIDHMPTVNALWKTGYGVAILVKVVILLAALAVASGNLLRTAPALGAAQADPRRAAGASGRLRGLASAEVVLVGGAVFVAALLSSLAPPPSAFALQNAALAQVGPGPVAHTVTRNGYRLSVVVAPNRAAAPDTFILRITKRGRPVRHANVTLTFNHTQMEMPQQQYQLTEIRPGVYARSAPALIMVGNWTLGFQVTPPGGQPFTATILDEAEG
ncbi:MAG: copper resistance CopC/CopD family protein [Solirubrobacteraceae bacterium]